MNGQEETQNKQIKSKTNLFFNTLKFAMDTNNVWPNHWEITTLKDLLHPM
jgi:hypothetical protein